MIYFGLHTTLTVKAKYVSKHIVTHLNSSHYFNSLKRHTAVYMKFFYNYVLITLAFVSGLQSQSVLLQKQEVQS